MTHEIADSTRWSQPDFTPYDPSDDPCQLRYADSPEVFSESYSDSLKVLKWQLRKDPEAEDNDMLLRHASTLLVCQLVEERGAVAFLELEREITTILTDETDPLKPLSRERQVLINAIISSIEKIYNKISTRSKHQIYHPAPIQTWEEITTTRAAAGLPRWDI